MKEIMLRTIETVLLFLAVIVSSPLHAANGDVFYAKTAEGVTMKFSVVSEDNKTCMVGEKQYSHFFKQDYHAIDESIEGTITIPSNAGGYSVIGIEYSAFYNCKSLTSVIIPNCVTSIGIYAFEYCRGLTSITIPNSVTSIGSGAFYDCSGLTSITIPKSVTSIGSGAFQYCRGLTSITIPKSVTSIGSRAFSDCDGLTSIMVDDGNETYDSRNNCNAIIETATNTLLSGCMNSTIPNSVISIGSYAFYGCSGLTSITIPNSVTSIGDNAFRDCYGLTNITIPNSVTTIGNYAFLRCYGLTGIMVDDENKTYDSRNNCNAIIETATNTLLSGCMNSTIPSSVISIGKSAFNSCKSLTSITISNTVTSIGDYAFYECDGLTSITISNSVNYIGDYAFKNCSGLTNITIPKSVTSIGKSAFSGCSGLTSIDIPNSVTRIDNYGFSDCSGLTSITIPNSVNYIGDYAFSGCSGLTSIISYIKIPFRISSHVFDSTAEADATLSVPFGSRLRYEQTDEWKDFSYIVELEPMVGDIFTSKNDENVDMWFMITDIEKKTCQVGIDLDDKTAIDKATKGSLTIPTTANGYSVTEIGRAAFAGCDGLAGIFIPHTVIAIANGAFDGCNGLTSITIDGDNKFYDSRGNCNAIIETASNTLILGCRNSFIPNSVTDIGNSAFKGCSSLTGIIIPNVVTSIGDYAFSGCSSLTSITIPCSVTEFGKWTFEGCNGLTSITCYSKIPFDLGVDVFTPSVFTEAILKVPCGFKTQYEQTDGWKEFANIVELGEIFTAKTDENVDMMFMVTDAMGRRCQVACGLGGDAAVSITTQGTLTIPNKVNGYTVTEIGCAAFSGCESLTSIYIPSTVTAIDEWAFYGITDLMTITLPASLKKIGVEAFAHADQLASVRSEIADPFIIPSAAFLQSNGETPVLLVPLDSKERYQSVEGWSQFAKMIEIAPADGYEFSAESGGIILHFKVTDRENRKCQVELAEHNAALQYATHIIIPNEVRDQTVIAVCDRVFANYTELLSISFPETVTEVGCHVLEGCDRLAAIRWDANKAVPTGLIEDVNNPNLLLYVKDKDYAPLGIQNVVANGVAESIILKETPNGNNFYCTEQFTAKHITYTHHYSMTSGYKTCQGWETIALPFDVTTITHESDVELTPITLWDVRSSKRTFWLYEQTAAGWQAATAIKANTPYIICMPNNVEHYEPTYCMTGNVIFTATDATVPPSDQLHATSHDGRTFVPGFLCQQASDGIYALNVENEWDKYNYTVYFKGSTFLPNLRAVHPFEAYMTTDGNAVPAFIRIFEDTTPTEIEDALMPVISRFPVSHYYNLNGQRVENPMKGIYVINGKKVVVK